MARYLGYYMGSDGFRRPIKGFDNQTIWINPDTGLIQTKGDIVFGYYTDYGEGSIPYNTPTSIIQRSITVENKARLLIFFTVYGKTSAAGVTATAKVTVDGTVVPNSSVLLLNDTSGHHTRSHFVEYDIDYGNHTINLVIWSNAPSGYELYVHAKMSVWILSNVFTT